MPFDFGITSTGPPCFWAALIFVTSPFENMAALMGGVVKKTAEKATGWEAPSDLVQITSPLTIQTDSSHEINIRKAFISAYIDGDLNLDSVSKVKVEVEVMIPDDGSKPYSIDDVAG